MPQPGLGISAGFHAAHSGNVRARMNRPHAHDFHMLTVFLAPPRIANWGNKTTAQSVGLPSADDAIVWPAQKVWSTRWETDCECVTIRITVDFLQRVANSMGEPTLSVQPAVIRSDPFLVRSALTLAQAGRDQSSGDQLFSESLGTALTVRLLQAAGTQRPPLVRSPLDTAVLQQVARYIDAHLGRALSVPQLAAVAGLSQWHFSRAFKTATGLTPHQYVVQRRLLRAKELLETTERKLAAIALDVGFASQSHLAVHFRRQFGQTPGQYAGRR
ncbi:AraC family transcriptional regulator [Blastopirellula sp. J2-11]|uniref:helix-turn-helix domain-containing protein n=1 Tax=Blastopirellula sp. J2-11 TaxID=2943192 RepID=UPI0021CA7B23|nr:AraC family transcriptional regulator [Blastopirellula sp. J2-11]UUO06359.1 AraC family transcriptional regulator [Blastopirellula sp. J2-11]